MISSLQNKFYCKIFKVNFGAENFAKRQFLFSLNVLTSTLQQRWRASETPRGGTCNLFLATLNWVISLEQSNCLNRVALESHSCGTLPSSTSIPLMVIPRESKVKLSPEVCSRSVTAKGALYSTHTEHTPGKYFSGDRFRISYCQSVSLTFLY